MLYFPVEVIGLDYPVINTKCCLCGKDEFLPSVLALDACYSSNKHDGERYTLLLCGSCIDTIIDTLLEHRIPMKVENIFDNKEKQND